MPIHSGLVCESTASISGIAIYSSLAVQRLIIIRQKENILLIWAPFTTFVSVDILTDTNEPFILSNDGCAPVVPCSTCALAGSLIVGQTRNKQSHTRCQTPCLHRFSRSQFGASNNRFLYQICLCRQVVTPRRSLHYVFLAFTTPQRSSLWMVLFVLYVTWYLSEAILKL